MQSDINLLAGINAVALAANSKHPHELFAAVDQYAFSFLHQSLCTVNRFDAARQRVVRLYSSNPAAYPVGGSKDKAGTPWGKHVLLERRMFVGEGAASIRESFDDFEAIQTLGLQSVINVPVVARDTCLGTINFLMREPGIQPGKLQCAQLAALLATPGFMVLPGQEGN